MRYDTTYLTADAIGRPPEPGFAIPFSQDGVLRLGETCGEVHPVTWLTLPYAVPAAGVRPEELVIAADGRPLRRTAGGTCSPTGPASPIRLASGWAAATRTSRWRARKESSG